MSWVNTYKPNEKHVQKQYEAYRGQLAAERAKMVKSNQLTRKDFKKYC